MADDAISVYDEAWNAPDTAARDALLARCLAPDAELIDPLAGRIVGVAAISARIGGFGDRFPGARVSITSPVDEHNGFARYTWTITDAAGSPLLHGMDVVERADDLRLRRIVMFFDQR